jgi:hypothetical protein
MQIDPLVTKRFAELEAKSHELERTQKSGLSGGGNVIDIPLTRQWGTSVLHLLTNVFGRDSDHYKDFERLFGPFNGWAHQYDEFIGVFRAAKEDYEGGYLFKMTSLIKAEVFADTLEQAEALLTANYKDAACVVIGITLELSLKELCTKNNIPHGKADKMNADLCKAGTYNGAKQKQITAWLDLRNKAAHGQWQEYTAEDVKYMLEGVRAFVGDFL